MTAAPSRDDRIAACLLGGAIGDALGAGIEFSSLAAIRRQHGPAGIEGYVAAYGGLGRFTDDTQMTLFTAEGLLRAAASRAQAMDDVVEHIRLAYLRWLSTQSRAGGAEVPGGLASLDTLRQSRAPGNTCLSALHAGGRGTPDAPINDSKGCGGVMRVAPIGLVADDPFTLAARAAALTHGHVSGYLSAGAFARMIHAVAAGTPFADAVTQARAELQNWTGHDETTEALDNAIALADRGGPPTPEQLEGLGGGWVGEEALAIAVCCVLAEPNPRRALLLAVNHSGDSDSTGALVGNLLGAMHGVEALPPDLLEPLEARDVIAGVARDLAAAFPATVSGP